MNRSIPLFLVLAILGAVAAQAQEAKVVPRKDDLASVVANERAALAKLGEMEADFAVSPTGHITAIEVGLGQHSMRLSPSPTGGFILLGPDPRRRTRQRVGHELPLGTERAGKSLHFQSARKRPCDGLAAKVETARRASMLVIT